MVFSGFTGFTGFSRFRYYLQPVYVICERFKTQLFVQCAIRKGATYYITIVYTLRCLMIVDN